METTQVQQLQSVPQRQQPQPAPLLQPLAQKPIATQQLTFDQKPFDQLLTQYNHQQSLPSTVDLTHAFLMTSNMTAAANTNLNTAQFDTVTDYLGAADSLAGSMLHLNRVMQGEGPSDRHSNFFIAQKQYIQAQARQDTGIRDEINDEIVDGLEYVRQKEMIAHAKQRTKHLLYLSEDSDASVSQKDTTSARDSQDARTRQLKTQDHLKNVAKQLRSDAWTFLGIDDKQIPLSTIYKKLSRNKVYLNRRQLKSVDKQLQKEKEIQSELTDLNQKIAIAASGRDTKSLKSELRQKIAQLRQVLDLEQSTTQEQRQPVIPAEIDQLPLNANTVGIMSVLQSQTTKRIGQKRGKIVDSLFGKYKKLPQRSQLLQSFPKETSPSQQPQSQQQTKEKSYHSSQEIVKVIGLEPELLFQSISKYKVDVAKMPAFSNQFENYESFIPGASVTHTAAPITQAQNISDKQSYVRLDGRSVLSLPFNPYQLDSKNKEKLYQAVIHDFFENRNNAIKQLSTGAREKLEATSVKKVWTQIAKRDIPKAFRAQQRHHTDVQNATQKLAVACQKEMRRKVFKSQRVIKESVQRCKKLTREVMSFWKKRDRQIATEKKKKDLELRAMVKKQEELREAELQKRRLEYLMKQSEIYAHFMANKMGMGQQQADDQREQIEAEARLGKDRVQVDEESARRKMAKMINEDRGRLREFDGSDQSIVNEEDLDVNRFDADNQMQAPIEQPTILHAKLKEYQLRGLRWLDNLYEQGINGILADEMGLGKTIQAISLMAHIAEAKGVWGPFLIIVPVATLHNWQNELRKFCPQLKVLPYFGNQEERKKLSKFLDPKNLMNPALQIHVVITSYNLIVNNLKDQAKLMKIKWNYMILDEAQAIKNNASRRWKVLLQFQARNRLLLTGTPIQNSMAELWALLHFIMPKLFENHEEFQEWFSKDIEASSLNQGELNKIQLKRLHAVLKPFMLRRLKKDVEQEIAPKTEVVLHCNMTYRQRQLYQRIRSKISYKDLHTLSSNKSKMENLMNLVMHMRKVCNHPDLFESRDARIPVAFNSLQVGVIPNQLLQNCLDVRRSFDNPIEYSVPKLIFDELWLVTDNQSDTFKKLIPKEDIALANVSRRTHFDLFNIFNAAYIHENMWRSGSMFGILRVFSKSNGLSVSELATLLNSDPLLQLTTMLHYRAQLHKRRVSEYIHQASSDNVEIPTYCGMPQKETLLGKHLNMQIVDLCAQEFSSSIVYREQHIMSQVDNSLDIVRPLINAHRLDFKYYMSVPTAHILSELEKMYVPECIADTVQMVCNTSGPFSRYAISTKQNPSAKRFLLGTQIKLQRHLHMLRGQGNSQMHDNNFEMLSDIRSIIRLPNPKSLVQDCAKMQEFAQLIPKLVQGKHRCLVFCQMTKMLDLLEDYLLTQHLSYFRMDGSTSIQDRKFMVDEYQNNPNIFAFLLSTRAGGLGINLIAADTVIFYDIDWNPTMDEQATDRAHRIGQTKPVTVYRLVTRGTVEEKIVRRAQQKQNVQSTVYGDSFKIRDVQMMLADDDEPEQEQKGFIKSKRRGGRKAAAQQPQASHQDVAMAQPESGEHSCDDSDEEIVMQLDGNEGGERLERPEIIAEDDDVEMEDNY